MRILALACLTLLLPMPAQAWDFTSSPICTLSHTEDAGAVRVTYDPRAQVYAIALTRAAGPWPQGAVFAIQFSGGAGLTISTNRHVLGADGAELSVTDSGFGNVLRGLEANRTATAALGPAQMTVSLAGAAPEVARFRACAGAATV